MFNQSSSDDISPMTVMSRPPMLTSAQIAFFKRYGYLVVPGVIEDDAIEELKNEISEAISTHSGIRLDLEGLLDHGQILA
jgi:hypothetical protein